MDAWMAFADPGPDRAAERRADADWIAGALQAGRVLPLWQGRPLVAAGSAALAWVPADHPALDGAAPAVFLGLDDGRACFACDVSDGTPPDQPDPPPIAFADSALLHHPALPADTGFAELRGLMLRLSTRDAAAAATAKALLGWHRTHGFCAACGQRTDPVQAGWQRRCPACGTAHFPRTDPVVIMLVTKDNRTLVGRSPGWPAGMYSCLAGFVEPGETVEAAVRREVAEETGVPIGAVHYVASQPWPFPASLMLGCRAEALAETITPDPAEIEDARWLTREEMVEVMIGTHPEVRPARRGAIAHALITGWLAGARD